ncbi:MAG: response regulator, partial [Pseudomonadota bacterium]|nr:response regulator [Pseudomonadota bacterium]
GQIRVVVELLASAQPGYVQLLLQVHDSGMGISVQDQQRLFQPFAQAGDNTQAGRSGAGLGLVISRNLCEMMGGSLQLESRLGVGTLIKVSLNLVCEAAEPCRPSADADILFTSSPLNVLVVDDHPANRSLMCQQLEFLGHHSTVAEDGSAGLDAWQTGSFDLVIVDCNMPIMNGYELARAIRRHEQTTQNPPCTVLGYTANALPEETQRCRHAGMDDCLFKPLTLTALSARLAGIRPSALAPAFSLAGLHLLTGGNPAMDRRLLKEMQSSNDQDRLALQALAGSTDLKSYLDLAHKIKGAARIIQATRLIESCEALENICHETDQSDQLINCSAAMHRAMDELDQALQQQIALNDQSTMAEP